MLRAASLVRAFYVIVFGDSWMPATLTIEQRRAQLEQLWRDNRYEFLSEYRRIVGQPVNDPTMSLRAVIGFILDREMAEGRFRRDKP
jgi:hypothetical protein